MLKKWMHKRERRYAMLNDNRVVRPFEWGTEFADSRFIDNSTELSPDYLFRHYSARAIARSDEFFALSAISDLKFEITGGEFLSWQSPLETPSAANNTVRARFFESENQRRKRAVIVLPHWNAPATAYISLCKVLNRVGISALRLALPYHEERRPPELERADYLVCPNVGRTLQSVRQAVLDTKAAALWLKNQGFEQIGIVGTSIGSCTAFLAFAHDLNFKVGVFNHVSGYFADVVWRGISTYHVRESLEKHVSPADLRKYWLPISPFAYMGKLKNLPSRQMRFIYTLYDLTFPVDLSRETIAELRKNEIKHDLTILPCGHYTLGEAPWVYLDGYKIVNYFRRHL